LATKGNVAKEIISLVPKRFPPNRILNDYGDIDDLRIIPFSAFCIPTLAMKLQLVHFVLALIDLICHTNLSVRTPKNPHFAGWLSQFDDPIPAEESDAGCRPHSRPSAGIERAKDVQGFVSTSNRMSPILPKGRHYSHCLLRKPQSCIK
jgi:hypothetical protein